MHKPNANNSTDNAVSDSENPDFINDHWSNKPNLAKIHWSGITSISIILETSSRASNTVSGKGFKDAELYQSSFAFPKRVVSTLYSVDLLVVHLIATETRQRNDASISSFKFCSSRWILNTFSGPKRCPQLFIAVKRHPVPFSIRY